MGTWYKAITFLLNSGNSQASGVFVREGAILFQSFCKVGKHLETYCGRGDEVGTCYARFCKSVLLQGQVFVPMTCCVKFSCFEFMCHEAGAKWYLVCTGRLTSRIKPFSSPEPMFLLVTWSAKRNFVPRISHLCLPWRERAWERGRAFNVISIRTGLIARQSPKFILWIAKTKKVTNLTCFAIPRIPVSMV